MYYSIEIGPTIDENALNYYTHINKLNYNLDSTKVEFDKVNNTLRNNTQYKTVTGHTSYNRINVWNNETELLNNFLNSINQHDIDIIVGHDLHNNHIELLIQRCKALKIFQWDKIGRLRRKIIPNIGSNNDNNHVNDISYVDKNIACGRLLADTLVTSKELLLGQKQYTLTYLAETQLGVQLNEIDNNSIANHYMDDVSSNNQGRTQLVKLTGLIRNVENEAYIVLRLMFQIELIQLTKHLTNLCGNLWHRTMRASRAERIEWLLLHQFHKIKYIKPEKYTSKEKRALQDKIKKLTGNNDDSNNNITTEQQDDNDDNDNTVKRSSKKRGKPQYSGGLVLEPKKGFYDKYILLLDYNSLYPSIIQEYNICFTTINHWNKYDKTQHNNTLANTNDDIFNTLPSLPKPNIERGKLPYILKVLIEQRAMVKKEMKTTVDPIKYRQQDIRQKALKLVANSMYGCLGFQNSRFYCESLAALVTAKGRETLQSTVDLVENNFSLDVIYGDTDSIMINTNENDVSKVRSLGYQIVKEVGKRYKVLELGLDGMYRNMLLLRKKKYAALAVENSESIHVNNDNIKYKREIKGLDLVRRDWCELSRKLGNDIIDIILPISGKTLARDDMIGQLHSTLEQVSLDIDNNNIPLNDYVITKSLTKNPHEYNDAKNQPHVMVALRSIEQGYKCSTGDIIQYVICVDDTNSNKSLSERAYHPREVQAANGKLMIDTVYYKTHQLLPPVQRLCSVIEETNAARLAQCLGLNSKNYESNNINNNKINDINQQEIIIVSSIDDDIEKYKHCKNLQINCIQCNNTYNMPGVYHYNMLNQQTNNNNSLQYIPCGLVCSTCNENNNNNNNIDMDVDSISSNILNTIQQEYRKHVTQYYMSDYQCNDDTCNRRTKLLSLKGNKCSNKCNGLLNKIYSHEQLYLQLSYYISLFDINRASHILAGEDKRRISELNNTINNNNTSYISIREQSEYHLTQSQRIILTRCYQHIKHLMDMNAYHWIPLSTVFDFAQLRINDN